MPGEFGLSFAPTGRDDQQQNGQAPTPIQDAIKLLSLRIPQFAGARGIAPQELLMGQGGAGLGAGQLGGLEQFLRQMFGQMGQAPMPNVTPGLGQGDRPPQGPLTGGPQLPPIPRGGPGGIPGWPERQTMPSDWPGGGGAPLTDPGIGANMRRRMP